MKKEILKAIQAYETVILHRHVRPDPDAYGSQMGLAAIIRASFPEKKVYSVGEAEPSLAFLGQLDSLSDDVYQGALVIVCDTANTERIDDERYSLGDRLIKIDHHPNDDAYGDLIWVNTKASSCSEMITAFYEEFSDELVLNETAARLLYGGIVGDTGRFLYPSTTEETFRMAAKLVEFSFDRSELYQKLYEVPLNTMRLSGYIFEHFELEENGAATIYISKEILNKFGCTAKQASNLVSSVENAKGLKAWLMFIEEEDDIRVRLRSKGPVINELAKKYRGGGHPLASGATVYTQQEVQEMRDELIQLCENDKKDL
ncbi:bifunctional oligoribonuclease/PAP phosphatase NrnA [Listeria aquatica]|uniref:Bifunctional oligoribonuclease/PAP phosphatase NrnA n=1 Tax=Listeria aquatica TaxID=1494960 RepID=A0A841ZQL3_9LIST|nr:bifunctional oligoribonuclease/PAP phosphatase NrnA [Listeria aquatica]MBC1520931.1 bifunctional oligoribonuclease/PAP phosphatase NrnA [Listeria aquatica]